MPDQEPAYLVRPLRPEETDAVIRLWHRSKQVAYPYLPLEQGRTVEEDGGFFREMILPRHSVWVAEAGGAIVGFLAIAEDYVDRLYIDPERQRRGAGSALISRAKSLSPAGVRLHTHQKNTHARAFYEKHGFIAIAFGVSPPPESEPDIEYQWTPGGDG